MVFSFFLWQFVQVSRQISIVCQRDFRVVASIEFWDCARLASLPQSRFGSFAFALSFSKMCNQNLLVSKHMKGTKFESIRVLKLKCFAGFSSQVNLDFGKS
ncbi:hypothetical protein BOO33_18295 [Vibrio navarrensis]|nr:hypothetical protein [Vibrio navarrensis]